MRSTFSFFDECFSYFACFGWKFGVAPQLGLQRHLASKGAPKGFQGVPKVSKRTTKITRAIVNINDGKRKIDCLTLFWDFPKLSFVFAPPGITFCALSSGHGPRGQGFEGFCKTLDFHNFWGSKIWKNMKSRMNMVKFGFLELSTLAKWSPKKSWNFPGFFSPKNTSVKGFIEKVRSPGGLEFPVHCGNSMNSNTNGPPPN